MSDGYLNPTYQSPAPQDLESSLTQFKLDVLKNFNCVRVGQIQSFNAANQTVIVRIAQQQVTTISELGTQTTAEYPLLAQVPVIFPGGGSFTLTFPIAAGDECVVLFNDRQLDNWKQTGAGQPPTIGRFHDLSDGIAIVGIRNFTRSLGAVSTTTTQLRSNDGTTYVEIANGGIVNVVAPTQIVLNSPIVTVQGIINVVNENSVADPCTIAGTIKATGDVLANNGSISLVNHLHSGVQTGSGNTGAAFG